MVGLKTLRIKGCATTIALTSQFFLLCICALFAPRPGLAQIIPDATTGTQIQPEAEVRGLPSDVVEGGTIRNDILFHSFQDFNIETGRGVYFVNPADIRNILSRVTGGNGSNIDGTLGVLGNANFFLINPNGIVFGPNAQLDIRGSFVASTADSLVFDNLAKFSAANPEAPPMLTLNITPGLQYGGQTASITNQGDLQVGRDLTLGAQRLNLSGQLEAGRDIILQGGERLLSGADYTTGGYLFTQDLSGAVLDFLIPHERVITAKGDVQLDGNYTGPSLYILAGGQVTQGVNVNNVITISGAGGGNITETISDGLGGTQSITVNANNAPAVDIRSGIDWSQWGGLPGNTNSSGLAITFGREGNDSAITRRGITLGNIANSGGAVTLLAQGDIDVGNLDSSTAIESDDSSDVLGKDGGDITLTAGGDINAEDLKSSTFTFLSSSSITGNATAGDGGDITLSAGGDINVEDLDSFSVSVSRSVSSSGDVVGGDGGDIILSAGGDIMTGDLDSLSGSASISNSVSGDVVGGDGGDIILSAGGDIMTGDLDSIVGANAGDDVISSTASSSGDVVGGDSGDITLSAGGDIMTGDSSSTSSSTSSSGDVTGGDNGDITLSAGGDIITRGLDSGSLLFSNSGGMVGGDSGDIILSAGRDIITRGLDSASMLNS